MNKIIVVARRYYGAEAEWEYRAKVVDTDTTTLTAEGWQWVGEYNSIVRFGAYFGVAWGSYPCAGMTFFLRRSPEELEIAWKTPYRAGDVLLVRQERGRIERSYFLVHTVHTAHAEDEGLNEGFRYDGVFQGQPELPGTVYSTDIFRKIK